MIDSVNEVQVDWPSKSRACDRSCVEFTRRLRFCSDNLNPSVVGVNLRGLVISLTGNGAYMHHFLNK